MLALLGLRYFKLLTHVAPSHILLLHERINLRIRYLRFLPISELEKKFQSLEGEVQVMRREAKARERRISELELSNSRLENCVQEIG